MTDESFFPFFLILLLCKKRKLSFSRVHFHVRLIHAIVYASGKREKRGDFRGTNSVTRGPAHRDSGTLPGQVPGTSTHSSQTLATSSGQRAEDLSITNLEVRSKFWENIFNFIVSILKATRSTKVIRRNEHLGLKRWVTEVPSAHIRGLTNGC